jgi:hypothetical protein
MNKSCFSEIVRAILFALLLVACNGCSQHTEPPPNISAPIDVDVLPKFDVAKAISIAKQAVIDRGGSLEKAVFEAERDGNGWQVLVWWEPAAPGDYARITIDLNGIVTGYSGGK